MYQDLTPSFTTWSLQNKTVLLRVDYNMTYFQDAPLSYFKIERTLKTIDYLLQKGAAIKLITHQEPFYDQPMSTEPLTQWFTEHAYPIVFSKDLTQPVPARSIMLCENIRFFDGEKTENKQKREQLAHDLRSNTDYYIFDGFGVAHRADTSGAQAPSLYTKEHRSIGFLVADEIRHLHPLLIAPAHPFIAFCAGNKEEKLAYLEKIAAIDTILVGPALSMRTTVTHKTQIPSDYIDTASIGPQTTAAWSHQLHTAGTVLCNGLMGFLEKPETLIPFDHLLDAIAQSKAYSIIAGGSTTSYVDYKQRIHDFSFCSTGGGATLAYLAQEKLPCLEPFL